MVNCYYEKEYNEEGKNCQDFFLVHGIFDNLDKKFTEISSFPEIPHNVAHCYMGIYEKCGWAGRESLIFNPWGMLLEKEMVP